MPKNHFLRNRHRVRVSALHVHIDGSLCLQRAETPHLFGVHMVWSPHVMDLLEPRACGQQHTHLGGRSNRPRGGARASRSPVRESAPHPPAGDGLQLSRKQFWKERVPHPPAGSEPSCHTHTAAAACGEARAGPSTHPGVRLREASVQTCLPLPCTKGVLKD